MDGRLRLMAVLAHPDDESLGFGGTLAKYAAEGVETSLVCATRGELGWTGDPTTYPGPLELGRLREAELLAAADALGVADVTFLDYRDGDLRCTDPTEAVARIAAELRRVRPDVVVTFGPDGAYGHPDHIAISQLTTAALVCAADPAFASGGNERPHRVAKLYHRVWTAPEGERFRAIFGAARMVVDGIEHGDVAWPEWAITTRIDTGAHWRAVRDAVACHRSQFPDLGLLHRITAEEHRRLWATESFYRAYSTVNGGRSLERDLFDGLR